MSELVTISLQMDSDLLQQLDTIAQGSDSSRSRIIREAIRNYLKKVEEEQGHVSTIKTQP